VFFPLLEFHNSAAFVSDFSIGAGEIKFATRVTVLLWWLTTMSFPAKSCIETAMHMISATIVVFIKFNFLKGDNLFLLIRRLSKDNITSIIDIFLIRRNKYGLWI
jgi:hypothetical protein